MVMVLYWYSAETDSLKDLSLSCLQLLHPDHCTERVPELQTVFMSLNIIAEGQSHVPGNVLVS